MEKPIFQGAEAQILKEKKYIIKERISKGYRIREIDRKLITQRTKKEAKLLEKASQIINVPKVANVTLDTIVMEEIKGKRLAEILDKIKNKSKICKKIGISLAKLHDSAIIHGDLTSSNLIYHNEEIYFIDFGLGYESDNIEDKAVDLHVLKEALNAKHPQIAKKCFKSIVIGYKTSKNSKSVLERLKIVESRGRYKQQY